MNSISGRLGRLILATIAFSSFCLERSFAAPAPIQVKPGHITSPLQAGDVIGGQAGVEYSLVNVGSERLSGEAGERLVLFYGDRNGKSLSGEPGYFHFSLDRDSRRIVIDLAQVSKTAVDPLRLEKILSHSSLIASSEMTMDPADGSTNITLMLKTSIRAKVAVRTDKQARVVIEMRPKSAVKEWSR